MESAYYLIFMSSVLTEKIKSFQTQESLIEIDNDFLNFLPPSVACQLQKYRDQSINSNSYDTSAFIIELAAYLENFLVATFELNDASIHTKKRADDFALVASIKRNFVQRKALVSTADKPIEPLKNNSHELKDYIKSFDDISFANTIKKWTDEKNDDLLKKAMTYARWAVLSEEGRSKHQYSQLFKIPKKIDPQHLLDESMHEKNTWASHNVLPRTNFNLTSTPISEEEAYGEANYCIQCHKTKKDSCRTGLLDKNDRIKSDVFGQNLNGCPLDQKISEMNTLKSQGLDIAALAVICIDNPLVAATGSRICYDCVRACIFQKQEAVDIPKVETQILLSVLNLPWGIEIYYLLTQWNPLNFENPLPTPLQNKQTLVVGMGPAGFTLSYYLLRAGFRVTGIDALSVREFDKKLYAPIKKFSDILEDLEERTIDAFGGVMEYGITARWDKNLLKLVRLILQRNKYFSLNGGIRFGSTLTKKQALDMGFSAIGLCIGTGSPKLLDVPNNMATGVRTANDFLMNLQLLGAYKQKSSVNLQIRAPIFVVGAGLTAIDTATEARTYYHKQVLEFEKKYNDLVQKSDHKNVRKNWTDQDCKVADEFLDAAKKIHTHGRLSSDLVTVLYRKKIQSSPAYQINHNEITYALKEGIGIYEESQLTHIHEDNTGAVNSITIERNGHAHTLPAGSVIVATGIKPNINIAFDSDEWQIDPATQTLKIYSNEQEKFCASTDKTVFLFGDAHKDFQGSVVKAMASAKEGVKEMISFLHTLPSKNNLFDHNTATAFVESSQVKGSYLELTLQAPLHSKNFSPGHLYRLQMYDVTSPFEAVPLIAIEKLVNGCLSFLIAKSGYTTEALRNLKPKDKVNLMGPSGQAVNFSPNSKIVIISMEKIDSFTHMLIKTAKKLNLKIDHITKETRDKNFNYYENIIAQKKEDLSTYTHHFVSGSIHFIEKIRDIFKMHYPNIELLTYSRTPMQCMMKGVCGQCMQKITDKMSGQEKIIYSCTNTIFAVNKLDFCSIKKRLSSNHLLEKLAMIH